MVADLIFPRFSGILKDMTNILKPHDLYLKLDQHINGNDGDSTPEAAMALSLWEKIRFAESGGPAVKRLRSYITANISPSYAESLFDIIENHVNDCLVSTYVEYAQEVRKQAGIAEPASEESGE